jgi:hypothetical protein
MKMERFKCLMKLKDKEVKDRKNNLIGGKRKKPLQEEQLDYYLKVIKKKVHEIYKPVVNLLPLNERIK